MRVLPIGTEALIAQQQGCSSSMQPRADFLQPGGASAASVLLGDGMRPSQSSSGVFAFDAKQRRLLAVYQREYEKTLMGRYVDAATHKAQAAFELAPAATSPARTELGLGFDGQRYGVLIETRQGTSSFAQHFQLYAPPGGWVGQQAQLGSPRAVLPPSVIWTGSGYLVAAMTFDGPSLPIDPSRFTARLWSLTADGTLRELFDVDRMPALYPTLVWAGGRVALAWVLAKPVVTAPPLEQDALVQLVRSRPVRRRCTSRLLVRRMLGGWRSGASPVTQRSLLPKPLGRLTVAASPDSRTRPPGRTR